MKKLLLILLCLPFIGFGQDNNKKENSKFNFDKSNNYKFVIVGDGSKPLHDPHKQHPDDWSSK